MTDLSFAVNGDPFSQHPNNAGLEVVTFRDQIRLVLASPETIFRNDEALLVLQKMDFVFSNTAEMQKHDISLQKLRHSLSLLILSCLATQFIIILLS